MKQSACPEGSCCFIPRMCVSVRECACVCECACVPCSLWHAKTGSSIPDNRPLPTARHLSLFDPPTPSPAGLSGLPSADIPLSLCSFPDGSDSCFNVPIPETDHRCPFCPDDDSMHHAVRLEHPTAKHSTHLKHAHTFLASKVDDVVMVPYTN